MKAMSSKAIMIGTGSLLGLLLAISLVALWFGGKQTTSDIIQHDIAQLAAVFEKINEQCQIIDFDYQKNRIDFLNVVSFTGSEIGSMNLVYPEKWEGPYLDDNPTLQKKNYLIVRTSDGHFITPGEGVKLPNGKVVGEDIVLDENADIPAMMEDPEQLQFRGVSLAAPIKVGKPVERLERP